MVTTTTRPGHCWTGKREFLGLDQALATAPECPHGGHDEDDRDGALECVYDGISATCMLSADHPGEHEWTPDNEIVLVFR